MNSTTLKITRDSVAAGDDVDAPHEIIIEVQEDETIDKIIEGILESNYLPKIFGDKATWCVTGNKPLAIIAQEWTKPKVISTIDYLKPGNEFEKLHFKYHVQEDPEKVFKNYLFGKNTSI